MKFAGTSFLNSIRIRLAAWFTLVLALVLVTFMGAAYWFLAVSIARQTDRTLGGLAESFSEAIENEKIEGENEKIKNIALNTAIGEALEDLRFRDYRITILDPNGVAISLPRRGSGPKSPSDEELAGFAAHLADSQKNAAYFTSRSGDFEVRTFVKKDSIGGQTIHIFVSQVQVEEAELLGRFRNSLLIAVPLVLILAMAAGYFLARKSLAPVVSMSGSASQISATNLDERLPVNNPKDELGHLALVFNSLLDRLEASFEQQRRFMADASHELRTPLAIVRGESEVALSKDDRPTGELRESLEIVHDESKRLSKIVEDLFTLARADSGHFRSEFNEIYLDEILTESVRNLRILADKQSIAIALDLPEMPMTGDEQLIRRLFINLLDNAIKYNRPGGKVSIVGKKLTDSHQILISDTGVGIAEMDRTKIFDRFYRIDKARTRAGETETSGAGLGLSIAAWIAQIHHAKIEVIESTEKGTIFSVIFPIVN